MANLQIMKHYARHPREFVVAVLRKLWSIRPIRMVGATLRNLLHVNRIEKRVDELEQQGLNTEIGRMKKRISLLETEAISPAADMLRKAETAHAEKRRNDPERTAAYSRLEEKTRTACGDDLQKLELAGKDGTVFLKNCQSGSVDLILMNQIAGQMTPDELIDILGECARVLTEQGRLIVEAPDPEYTKGYHLLCDPAFGTVLHAEALKTMVQYAGLTDEEIIRVAPGDDGCADYILTAVK